jgi:hypothetical protein
MEWSDNMPDNAGVIGQFFAHPAGSIETAPGQHAVARVGALAGLTTGATEWLAISTILPTTVSMAE